MNLDKIQNFKSLSNTAFFRFKKFNSEEYLITNDYGGFHFLNEADFNDFISGKIVSGELFETLKKKNFIKKSEEEKNAEIAAYREKNMHMFGGPSLHIVVTTLRCNHACRYCHAAVAPEHAHEYDMSLETAEKTLQTIFFSSSDNIMIEFQGGESLLNWEVVEYMTKKAKVYARNLNKKLKIAIVTNLSLMTEEKFKFIKEQEIEISTSLDGDKVLHNHNRTWKKGDSYDRVTYWIKRINDEYDKLNEQGGNYSKIGALLTTTKKTLGNSKAIIDEYVNNGLDGIYLRPLNPYGFAENDLKNLAYNRDEFINFFEESLDYILELNKKGTFFREAYAGIFLTKILTAGDGNFLDERSPCGACIGQIAYNYDGQIYSCDEGRMLGREGNDLFRMGEVSENAEETYKEMMNSETTKMMVSASTVDGLPGFNDHVYKPYIGVCPINSYKTNGTLTPNHAKDFRISVDYKILDILFERLRDPENAKIFESWVGEARADATC